MDKIEVYRLAREFGNSIWSIAVKWPVFDRSTIGRQLTRSADSISANIAEGVGRYHYNDNRRFCYYARGSLYETEDWLLKAMNRGLVDKGDGELLLKQATLIGKKLNSYIKSIGANQRNSR